MLYILVYCYQYDAVQRMSQSEMSLENIQISNTKTKLVVVLIYSFSYDKGLTLEAPTFSLLPGRQPTLRATVWICPFMFKTLK